MRRVGPTNVHQTCADGLPGHPLDQVKVVDYHCAYSAFNGYHFTQSDYSALRCRACGTSWRTKARYVEEIGMLA